MDSCKSKRDFWQMYDPGTTRAYNSRADTGTYVAMVFVGYGIAAMFSPQTGRFLRIEWLRDRNSNRIWSLRAPSIRSSPTTRPVAARCPYFKSLLTMNKAQSWDRARLVGAPNMQEAVFTMY